LYQPNIFLLVIGILVIKGGFFLRYTVYGQILKENRCPVVGTNVMRVGQKEELFWIPYTH